MLSKIKVVLDEGAKMPTKAHDTDAGFDLYAPKDFWVPAVSVSKTPLQVHLGELPTINIGSVKVDTGVHIQLPPNTVGMIKSKSGLNVKFGLMCEGVIDVGYTGSLCVKIYNLSTEPYEFKRGNKIAQLVILPIITPELEQVDELEETERGDGGFGSTGR